MIASICARYLQLQRHPWIRYFKGHILHAILMFRFGALYVGGMCYCAWNSIACSQ